MEKILIVAPRFLSLSGGGEYFVSRLINSLPKDSWHIITRNESSVGYFWKSSFENCSSVIDSWIYVESQNIFQKTLRNLSLLLFEVKAYFLIRKFNASYSKVFCANLYFLPLFLGRKAVSRLHGPPGLLKGYLCKYMDINLVANGDALDNCRARNISVREVKIFKPPFFNMEMNSGGKVLYVGRLEPIKGYDLLLDMLEAGRLKRVTVVGRGTLENERRHKTFVKEGRINHIAGLYGDELIDQYMHHEYFILLSRYDNLPNVILEAVSYGCKLILSENIPVANKLYANGLACPSNANWRDYEFNMETRPRSEFIKEYTLSEDKIVKEIWK